MLLNAKLERKIVNNNENQINKLCDKCGLFKLTLNG